MPTYPNAFAATTPIGQGLASLVSALYSGDSPAKLAEREAAIEERRQQAALRRAQIADYESKMEERRRQREREATAPFAVLEGLFPGQGSAVMDYRKAGGMVQPQPETAEVPGIIGGYEMPRPRGYTPQQEDLVNRIMAGIAASGALPGKSTLEDLGKFSGATQNQNVIADVLAGLRSPQDASAAVAAGAGKPFYKDNQGRVLNEYSGVIDESGAAARAGVAADEAQARERDAHAGLFRAQTAQQPNAQPLVPVHNPASPTGFVYSTRGAAVGQSAPIPGAQKVADTLYEKPTTPNVTAGQRELNAIQNTRSVIARFREAAAADERNFGLSGLIRATAQDAIQQGSALGLTVGAKADEAVQYINQIGTDVGVENFDKNIPMLDLYANVLAFQMAQALAPGDRVTDRDFKIFRSLIGDSAILGNQRAVMERLSGIEAMLGDKERTIQTFLRIPSQPPAPAAAPPPTAAAAPEPTATNPATGEKLVFRNGQWLPLR